MLDQSDAEAKFAAILRERKARLDEAVRHWAGLLTDIDIIHLAKMLPNIARQHYNELQQRQFSLPDISKVTIHVSLMSGVDVSDSRAIPSYGLNLRSAFVRNKALLVCDDRLDPHHMVGPYYSSHMVVSRYLVNFTDEHEDYERALASKNRYNLEVLEEEPWLRYVNAGSKFFDAVMATVQYRQLEKSLNAAGMACAIQLYKYPLSKHGTMITLSLRHEPFTAEERHNTETSVDIAVWAALKGRPEPLHDTPYLPIPFIPLDSVRKAGPAIAG